MLAQNHECEVTLCGLNSLHGNSLREQLANNYFTQKDPYGYLLSLILSGAGHNNGTLSEILNEWSARLVVNYCSTAGTLIFVELIQNSIIILFM